MTRELRRVGNRRLWTTLLLALLALPGIASAQQSDPDSVLTDPKAIAFCLCLEQSVAAKAADMRALGAVYSDETRQLAAMNDELDRRRPLVDVQNQAQIDAFKVLLEQRDAALDKYQWSTLPKYQASVARYNEKVDMVLKRCSGHPLDQAALDQAKQKLSCPAE